MPIPIPALYGLSLLVPLAATFLLTPVAARLAHRLEVLDHPGPSKVHDSATPYLGGVALAIGLVLVAGVVSGAEGQLLVILTGAMALSIVGLLDDQRIIRWWVKLLMEVLAGYALWLVGVRAGLFDVQALDLMLTLVWVVGITNAVNMLDNMDGLASGVSAIAALGFFAIAALEGEYLVAAFSLTLAGASLGFLRWNFPPAKVFLGDAGTLFLGFLLAAIGLKLDLVGENGFIRSAVPILVLAVPIFDAILVIVARLRGRRPIYLGGTDHSSHRLAALGHSARRIAVINYAVQGTSSAVAIWVLSAAWTPAVVTVVAISVAALGLLVWFLRLPYHPRQPEGARLEPAELPPPR